LRATSSLRLARLCAVDLRQAGWRWLWLLRLGRGCAFDGMGAVRAGAQPYLGPRPSGVAGRRRNGWLVPLRHRAGGPARWASFWCRPGI